MSEGHTYVVPSLEMVEFVNYAPLQELLRQMAAYIDDIDPESLAPWDVVMSSRVNEDGDGSLVTLWTGRLFLSTDV
jgi:hypothetical protein